MLTISSPKFSFVQFGESSVIESCNFNPFALCLPVYQDDDVAFQFTLEADSEEEADDLCDLANDLLVMGIAERCEEGLVLNFQDAGYRPERYRISPRRVLYNWEHGLPGFSTVIDRGQCFVVKVLVSGQEFCTNCFQRIGNDCHTSVIDYGNDENAFEFNYCSDAAINPDSAPDCEPLIISFTNKETLSIPYTAQLQDLYGLMPTVQVWIYDGGELVDAGIQVKFDTYPPNLITMDFGGPATGIVKIK